MSRLPLIDVTACTKQIGLHPYHITGGRYLHAVVNGADGLPLTIPALSESIDQAALLDSVDGLPFTGSSSNVESRHYDGPTSEPGTLHNSDHDATTLPLIHATIDAGILVPGICHGFREMSAAFGDSLHQKAHEVGTFMDHRGPADQPLEVQCAPRHVMHVQPGGTLAGVGLPSEFQVNSIHGQGADRLAPDLRVEALASDGLVEAVSVEGAKAFALGVQWHPEWQALTNPNYLAIFQVLGKARGKKAGQR